MRIDRPIVSSEKLLKQALRVGTQDSGDLDKFDDIEPAFAGLKSTYEGLRSLKGVGKVPLRHFRGLSGGDEHRDDTPVARAAKGFA